MNARVFRICVMALAMSGLALAQAQTPPAAASKQAPAADRLPVRRVVLYKSGVGYFEHLGRVRGSQNVTIDFTSGQLDDVLKSLTTLDLDGGRVSGVSYNSEAGLDRRISALRLPVGEQTTRAQLLTALRGARLDVRVGANRILGRLLSVERIERRSENAVTATDALSIVSDTGEIHTIALDPGVSVRIAEADLNEEVGKYLALVASVRDQDLRRLTIATTGAGDRDLFVSYVSEVPVWKATYRLVLPTAAEPRKPLLQGWAIVDNTVGEDWTNVELSLVAGAPQSFVQSISRPYYVQRPVVPLPERVLLSPQTHQGALATAGAGGLAGTVTDSFGSALPGVTVRVSRGGARAGDATTDTSGRYRLTGIGPGAYEVTFALNGFRTTVRSNVNVSGGMETIVNASMELGTLSESVVVQGQSGGVVGGAAGRGGRGAPAAPPIPAMTFRGTLDSVSEGRVDAARQAQQIDAAAAQLGDLFEYKLKEPVTIRKNQSALVPILGGDVQADKVSLWNASTGGSRPLRAVWLTNSTGLTLDGGSFTVIEGQAFAGEGLTEPLKAGERRLLSYAIDLGILIDSKGESVPTRITRVQVSRGLLIQHTEERQRRTYTARNDDAEARTLVIEHPARAGWTLSGDVKPAETTPAWHRFRVPVAPKTTVNVTVEDIRPVQTQYSINNVTDDQVALLVREKALTAAVEAALRDVLAQKAEIARLSSEMQTRQSEIEQIGRDQDRVRENMKSLKGSSEERQLLQRYVRQLDEQETRLDALRKELAALTAERTKKQAALAEFISEMAG
jgi:hypothetical protein